MQLRMILQVMAVAVLILALAGFIFFAASGQKPIEITKTVLVKADLPQVFSMVQHLNQYPKWSPFLAQDPSQQYAVKGEDGQVGAQYHWNGNKGKDVGYQEIVRIEPGNAIGMQCRIFKPFVATPTFDYTFRQTAEGVLVTQFFRFTPGKTDAFFIKLFGVTKKMAETNEQGLALLKKAVEDQP